MAELADPASLRGRRALLLTSQAEVAELADALDSKSSEGNFLRVRLPPSALGVSRYERPDQIGMRAISCRYNPATAGQAPSFGILPRVLRPRSDRGSNPALAGRLRPAADNYQYQKSPTRGFFTYMVVWTN